VEERVTGSFAAGPADGYRDGHPDVEDVAVLGIPDDYAGERPKAYVVLKSATRGDAGTQTQAQAVGRRLIKYVQEKKVRHKWVTEVEFIDEIPKSPSGKILRRVLRDLSKSGKRGVVVKDERARL